jgi:ribonuclease Z
MASGKDAAGVAFNKTRAEGKDGRKDRSMELKNRRANPISTTSYVQVRKLIYCLILRRIH